MFCITDGYECEHSKWITGHELCLVVICIRIVLETLAQPWLGRERRLEVLVNGGWRLFLAVIAVHIIHLRMRNNKGKSRC